MHLRRDLPWLRLKDDGASARGRARGRGGMTGLSPKLLADGAVWASNISSAVGIIFVNKLLMSREGFGFRFGAATLSLAPAPARRTVWAPRSCRCCSTHRRAPAPPGCDTMLIHRQVITSDQSGTVFRRAACWSPRSPFSARQLACRLWWLFPENRIRLRDLVRGTPLPAAADKIPYLLWRELIRSWQISAPPLSTAGCARPAAARCMPPRLRP